MEELFLEFIRYFINEKAALPENIEKMDWAGLFRFCQEQAIAGVVFEWLKVHGEGLKIPKEVLLQWFALSEQIKQRNMLLNKRCVELTEMLRKDGFQCCILKGQGNALMYEAYPQPLPKGKGDGKSEGRDNLGMYRQPGDIDVWVMPEDMVNGSRFTVHSYKDAIRERRRVVTEYVRRRFPKTRIRYQHIDYPVFTDVDVEVHFIPTAKNNPIFNQRIQKWAEEERVKADGEWLMAELPDGQGRIPVPTVEFNVIYQMSHLMHHFFDEGIGLRQMIDYYYVLKKFRDESLEFRDSAKSIELEETLKYLGLWKFAGAVMYVMREVFGLEENYMIAPVDEKRGMTLMNEILKGGNFGKYSGLTQHSTGGKYFLKHWRNLHFVKEYPSEALSEPIFRTWHFFWRLRHR